MRRLNKQWRFIVAFSLLGLLVAGSYVTYLWIAYPNRDPKVEKAFDLLCPPSVLTFVCVDVPCTTADYARLWTFAAIFNAGIYAVVGGLIAISVSKLQSLLKH
jgi:hypothetical protein